MVGLSFTSKTFNGTTTDVSGSYSLDVSDNVTLQYLHGYKTEILTSGGTADFSLEPDVLKQDEVVVTGLVSSVKRRNLQMLCSVSGDDLVNAPIKLGSSFKWSVCGVNIRRNTGAPGGGVNVNQEVNLPNWCAQPLYVVDGLIVIMMPINQVLMS